MIEFIQLKSKKEVQIGDMCRTMGKENKYTTFYRVNLISDTHVWLKRYGWMNSKADKIPMESFLLNYRVQRDTPKNV